MGVDTIPRWLDYENCGFFDGLGVLRFFGGRWGRGKRLVVRGPFVR